MTFVKHQIYKCFLTFTPTLCHFLKFSNHKILTKTYSSKRESTKIGTHVKKVKNKTKDKTTLLVWSDEKQRK